LRALPLALVLLGACDRRPASTPPLATDAATLAQAAQPDRAPRGPAATPPATPLAAAPAAPRIRSGVFPATGPLLGSPPARGVREANGGEVQLNFVAVPVADVARAVLGDVLGLAFTVDANADAEITLETARPVPRDQVLPMFETALRAAGLAVNVDQGLYVVGLIASAGRTGLVSSGQPGFGTEVLTPRFVGAAQLRRLLEPVLREGQIAQADPSRNILLVTGTEAERRAVRETVAQFDVDWMRGMNFGLHAARHVNARRLAADLNQLLGGEAGTVAGLVRIVALERLNAVLTISPQMSYIRQVQSWAERLDRQGQGDERQVFVYRVQNARAADLARVLTRAFGGGGGTESSANRGGTAGAGPGGLFGATSGRGGLSGLGGLGGQGGTVTTRPLGSGGFAQEALVPLQGAAAPDASPFEGGPGGVPPVLAGPLPGGGAGGASVSITNDEANNALVILATPREYDLLLAALRQLDVLPLQVVIEAAIAEVTLSSELRFGLQWALNSGQSSGFLNQRTVSPGQGVGSSAPINALRGALVPQVLNAAVPLPSFPNFSYVYSAPSITVVLEALDSISSVNVLSAPQLLVLNNQTASLQVGDQVPVQTQSAQSVITSGAPLVSSIEYRDTGVILRVTPRVNESGLVLLDIAQEVSAVVEAQGSATSTQLSPTIQQRRIASSVAVQDGQTIALGGLIRDGRGRTRAGIPGLADIPILGYLFGNAADSTDRTELLVLLTPRVVRSQADALAATEELRRSMRNLEPIQDRFPRAPGSGRLRDGRPRF
jgi:general secretion pathway protein D